MSKVYEDFLPPPIKGMRDNINVLAGDKNYALYLNNWICRPYGLELHPAGELFLAPPVNSSMLFTYSKPTGTDQLFLANATGIYDISGATYPAASIALTSGAGCAVPLNTGAGSYLFYFNGVDTAKIFDGTTWAAASITGVTTSNLRAGCVYRKRLYMLEVGKLGFWYLSPTAISGAAQYYDAGTIFTRGGTAVAIAPWTKDGGVGADDYLAVFSSNGEVAIFSGNDPGASSWIPVGTYFVGQPPGTSHDQMVKFGGDLLVLTTSGVYSLAALVGGKSSPYDGGLSAAIIQLMTENLRAYPTARLFLLQSRQLLYVYFIQGLTFMMDLQTGGWSALPGITSGDGTQPGDAKYWIEFDAGNNYEILQLTQKNVYIGWRNMDGVLWGVVHPFIRQNTIHDKVPIQIRPYLQVIGSTEPAEVIYAAARNGNISYDFKTLLALSSYWAPGATISQTGLIFQHWITPQSNPGFVNSYQFKGTLPANNSMYRFRYLGADLRSSSAGVGGP